MAAKHKTQISHVDLDKAFANIRNYPGARTDRKVFKIIAEEANNEGVARFTAYTCGVFYRVSGADGLSSSLFRLVDKGILEETSYELDNFNYPHDGTVVIAPAYMLHTATTPEPSDGTERVQNGEKRLDNLTKVVANDDSGKKIVKLENRIEKLEHDNKTLRKMLKDCVVGLAEPIGELGSTSQ